MESKEHVAVRQTSEMFTYVWSEKLKGRAHLQDLVVYV
jgi:hypothetical protein